MMKAERFTGTFFLFVVLSFMCMALSAFLTRRISKLMNPEPPEEHIVIDWEKLYPFSDGKSHMIPKEKESFIERVKQKFESYASKNLPRYYSIVEAGRKYEDIIGWNIAAISDYNP